MNNDAMEFFVLFLLQFFSVVFLVHSCGGLE